MFHPKKLLFIIASILSKYTYPRSIKSDEEFGYLILINEVKVERRLLLAYEQFFPVKDLIEKFKTSGNYIKYNFLFNNHTLALLNDQKSYHHNTELVAEYNL